MRLAIAILFALCGVAHGAATNVNIRRLDYTNNVRYGAQQSREMVWYRGESVQYNVDVWRDSEQVAIPSTATVIWQAWKSNNLSVLYIAATGEVISADAGQVRATLTPAQANLASGAYNSALSLWDGTNYIGMAGVGQIRVIWTPAGDSLPYVGTSAAAYVPKPTNAWTAGYVLSTSDGGTTTYATAQSGAGSGTLTNIVRGAGSSTRLTVTNGSGPQVTLNLDVSGLATGTPLYVESDPVWTAASNATAQRVSSNAAGVVAVGLVASNAVGLEDSRGFTNSGGVHLSGTVALGEASVAYGTGSVASGIGTIASGTVSVAIGFEAEAFGDYTIAIGQAQAHAYNSVAIGDESIATGPSSLAMAGAQSVGEQSMCFGFNSYTYGFGSLALGYRAIASNDFQTTISDGKDANGDGGFYSGHGSNTFSVHAFAGHYFDGGKIHGNAAGLTNLPIYIASGGSIAQTETGAVITITGGSGAPQSPLTNNVNAAGYSITNGSFRGDGSGLTNLPVGAGGPAQPTSYVLTPIHQPQVATAATNDQIGWSEYAGRLVGVSTLTATSDLTAAGFVTTVTGAVGTGYASFDYLINPYCDAPTSLSMRLRGVNSTAAPPVIKVSYPGYTSASVFTAQVFSTSWTEQHFAMPTWATGRQSQVISVRFESSMPSLTNGTWAATLFDMSHGVRLNE